MRQIALVSSETSDLDPAASNVITRLSDSQPLCDLEASEARRIYARSRSDLLAPLEPVDCVQSFATAGCPALTMFRPWGTSKSALLPGLVFLHGGGWTVGDLQVYEGLCRSLANATGSVVVWVDYRLAPEHPFPAALEDSIAAVERIQESAVSFGIDPKRIGLAGDSAGGNLAAVIALAARNWSVRFAPAYQLLMYPCLDMTACQVSHQTFREGYLLTAKLYSWYRRNYLGSGVRVTDWRVSPLFAKDFEDVAPAVILSAGYDPLRDEALFYAAQLRDAGVPVAQCHFPRMIHGFLNMSGAVPAASVAVRRIGDIVQSFLAGRTADFTPRKIA